MTLLHLNDFATPYQIFQKQVYLAVAQDLC